VQFCIVESPANHSVTGVTPGFAEPPDVLPPDAFVVLLDAPPLPNAPPFAATLLTADAPPLGVAMPPPLA
jgi:hypothetical protein